VVNATPTYFELFVRAEGNLHLPEPYESAFQKKLEDDDVHLVWYYMPVDETRWSVVMCWEDTFAVLESLLQIPTTRSAMVKALNRDWGLVTDLLKAGIDPLMHPFSLTTLLDPDANVEKWFLAGIIGNLVVNDFDDLVSGRAEEVTNELVRLNLAVWEEVNTGVNAIPPSYLDEAGKAAHKEMLRKSLRIAQIAFDVVGWLQQ
jgi:hypothetical protein